MKRNSRSRLLQRNSPPSYGSGLLTKSSSAVINNAVDDEIIEDEIIDIKDQNQSSEYTLSEILNTKERTLKNKLMWGAAFGQFFFLTQTLTYFIFSFGSNFLEQANKVSFISDASTIDPISKFIITFATYSVSCSAISALLNVCYQKYNNWKLPYEVISEKEYKEKKSPYRVNKLFELVVQEQLLEPTNLQFWLGVSVFVAFLAFNGLYCITFWDVGTESIRLLPTYGGLYTWLNQYAGPISYVSNFLLNQWFAFDVIKSVIYNYNALFKITRPEFHKIRGASVLTLILFNILLTPAFSFSSALGFYALTQDDKAKLPAALHSTISISAFIVYGFVLNLLGSKGIINKGIHFWEWLEQFPGSAMETIRSLKKSLNPRDNWNEIKYFLGINSSYLQNNTLNLKSTDGSNTIAKQPRYTMQELKEKVDIRIRELASHELLTQNRLRELIIQERDALDKERERETEKSDIWKHGLIRNNLSYFVSMIGPGGLSIVLRGYYSLVEKEISKFFTLTKTDAGAKMFSFYLFFPFIYLVLISGYSAMNKLYNSTEQTIKEIYRSYCSHNEEDPRNIKDYDYTQRFYPENTQEKWKFLLGSLFFVAQVASLLLTPPSSGSVVQLLSESGILNVFTLHVAFWFTALFNSFGIASFLNYLKPKITDYIFHKDKREMLNWNAQFFQSMEDLPDCHFEINNLTAAAV